MAHTDTTAADRNSSQPHITVVSTHFAPETTGNAPYVTGLARALANDGFKVSVIAGAPHYPEWKIREQQDWEAAETVGDLSVQRLASYVPSRPTFVRRLAYEVLFGLRFAAHISRDADVVLLVSPSLFAAAVVRSKLWAARTSARTVLWTQDLYSAGLTETPGRLTGLLGKLMVRVEGSVARSCDAMVVIHPRFARYAAENFGVRPDRLSVIRNWTHISLSDGVRDAEFRVERGWTPDETVVLHAGNQGAKQGLENVVQAARIAENEQISVRFVLLGDGNQRVKLEQLAGDCRNIQFLDPLPDAEFQRALLAADVLLVNERPSLNEAAVPSKLTTYFATGKPIVAATDATSTTSEEMRASGAGLVVPPANPRALVDASVQLVKSWGQKSAQAGPDFVAKNLTAEAAMADFGSLLQGLLSPDATEKSSQGTRRVAKGSAQ